MEKMPTIEETIAEFEAKMKLVSPEDIQMAKGKTPAAETIAEPTGEQPACVNKEFKALVGVLPNLYVGMNLKDMLIDFLAAVPECEVSI